MALPEPCPAPIGAGLSLPGHFVLGDKANPSLSATQSRETPSRFLAQAGKMEYILAGGRILMVKLYGNTVNVLLARTIRYMAYDTLVYCATPARLAERKTEIMNFVIDQGKAPLHPFNALPIEYFETEKISRTDTLNLCCKLIDACDEFWLFGISEGTLTEVEYFFKHGYDQSKTLIKLFDKFDTAHQKYIEKYRTRFGDTFAKLETHT